MPNILATLMATLDTDTVPASTPAPAPAPVSNIDVLKYIIRNIKTTVPNILANFMGTNKVSIIDVLKKISSYVKKNDLQSYDKRYVKTDFTIRSIFPFLEYRWYYYGTNLLRDLHTYFKKLTHDVEECPVCCEITIPTPGHLCGNGHFTCRACTIEILKRDNLENRCPICRTPILRTPILRFTIH